ncbi:site-specific integrase [Pseudoalteromonas sp. SR45-1]|uniref:gamma-mobile-trio recombinase GmtY n=1 Tax=Pseudoalteromonas sp. SR45-1 TaxID=2760932 RepID=UPI001600AF8A|nr:gamma-mobile-trio recombinase GmtY [Pseudoalteromonas sp. SR45-1]MBB1327399.1 site-specific integrase [Pseudoalteromonas sp. SR45-1]
MSYVLKIKCKYKVDKTGISHEFPCVLTKSGVLTSHIQYLYMKRARSQSWVERSVFSIILLIKYIDANTKNHSNNQKFNGVEMLRSFTTALNLGTIDRIGRDSSGLFWRARETKDAEVILNHITQYTDFYSAKNENKLPTNTFRKASHIEEKINWCAYYHRQKHVFLNHLEKKAAVDKIKFVRSIKSDQPEIIKNEKVFKFPEDKIGTLLNYGFKKSGDKYPDYKNQLITMLMHYGGLRLSEVFHIYINDIVLDEKNNEAIVRVFHPSHGQCPESSNKTRRTYLQEKYALIPRNEYSKSLRLHAGWKTPLLTSNKKYFDVIFSNSNIAREFQIIWIKYLTFQRKNPPPHFQHPFAFTNSKGEPETIKNFRRMHENAVFNIGLNPCKDEGTSCHAHRHSYGYGLSKLGFSQVEIQKAMHHKSPDSCLVYIQPTSEDIRKKMREVEG